LVKQNKVDDAVAACRNAIKLQPDYALAHDSLGSALQEQKKLDEAIAAHRKAIELQPNFPQAHHNLGQALLAQNKLDESIRASRKAIELDPTFAGAHVNLGAALLGLAKVDEAIPHFRKAIKLQPTSAVAYYNLGAGLLAQKKLADAVAAFCKADELSPGHPRIQPDFRQAARWLELDQRLPAILAGKEKARNAREQIELAVFCRTYHERYRAAAKLYAAAFAAESALADELRLAPRFKAACTAALAAAGKGMDAAGLDDRERIRLRRQAHAWLAADLKLWSKLAGSNEARVRALVQSVLQHWQSNADLAALRDAKALAALPEAERDACRKLWEEVTAVQKQASGPR
jgi:Flp pilus assembly protein TadD